jgi:demethylmenaquinone methyltransferase/2-methoxy-6-polyprenyl-1,4-benzoquinol methylase
LPSGGEEPVGRPKRGKPHRLQTDAELAAYYEHRAPEMDEAYQCPERAADLRRLGVRLRRLVAGRDVLEIACGTGYWTRIMARSARSITAFDVSEAMLALARQKHYANPAVTFLRRDAWQLAGLQGHFDAAVALFWWSHLPHCRTRDFVASLCRLLPPGALLVFIDNLPSDCRRTPPVGVDADGNSYQRRRLRTGEQFEIIKNYPSKEELQECLRGLATRVRHTAFECLWLLTARTAGQGPGPAGS